MQIELTVNGEARRVQCADNTLLVDLLRDHLGLTGTHVGCDTSQCGCCTVHVDGQAVKSCTMLAAQAEGAGATIEGPGPGRPAAPGAAGVLGLPRPAVRLLHPRHDHGQRRLLQASTPATPPTSRSSTRSRATCAAAPAT
jgi:hypothetical protein